VSLRTKWALGLGVLVAVCIGLASVAANAYIGNELRDEVDEFLWQRSATAERVVRGVPGIANGGRPGRPSTQIRGGEFAQFDAVTQAINGGGEILIGEGDVTLPVEGADIAVAQIGGAAVLRDVTVDDVSYRMITIPVADNVALQIARDVTATNAVLRGVRQRLFIVGLFGSMAAALVGWFGAGQAVRPVRRIAAAAEGVADTLDLSAPLAVEGNDEVAQLATSFNTMMEALQQSRDQQHRLVMDASHELRTPLTSLRTNIELLERGIPSGEVRDRILGNASSELIELTVLVNELVGLATDSHVAKVSLTTVDLAMVAAAAVDRGEQRHHRQISLHVEAPEVVTASLDGIERALNNLIDNAAKFSPSDSPIDVTVNGFTINVRDYGPGISDADIGFVFDRFYRSAEARSVTGSGLGLAIVRQIAEEHGGVTSARNHPDGGAIVSFSVSG